MKKKLYLLYRYLNNILINFSFFFQTLLAKAVYDNIAETPDEIAFRRGDVLTVIETDTNGLEGWWLCSFRGKQGIAPGNRLKILTKMVHNENDTLKANKNNWNDTQNKVSKLKLLLPRISVSWIIS